MKQGEYRVFVCVHTRFYLTNLIHIVTPEILLAMTENSSHVYKFADITHMNYWIEHYCKPGSAWKELT